MSQERTYTIIQRDEYSRAVNTMTGLDQVAAETLAAVLRTGDAYTGDRPWTCDIERELTEAEQAQEAARKWREGASEGARVTHLNRVSHIAQALRDVAADLDGLGEMEIPESAMLAVKIQVFGQGMPTVDAIAGALGQTASRDTLPTGGPGHYGTGHGDLQVVTTAQDPTPDGHEDEGSEEGDENDTAPVEHRQAEFWKDGDGSGGQCGASCACGTAFDGFDSLAEATAFLDRHIADPDGRGNTEPVATPAEPASERIPAERVDELLTELNQLTVDGAEWWEWLAEQPEFDREASVASADTFELRLNDGTALVWAANTSWTRAAVA